MSDADDLDARWASLRRPGGALLDAEHVTDWPGGEVLVAIDTDGRRHLLVGLPESASTVRVRPLHGLVVKTRRMKVRGGEHLWADLELSDPRGARSFSTLCVEVLDSLSHALTADGALLTQVIERWRRFWTVAPDGLTPDERLGLFGELWLLTQWIPTLTTNAISSWRGPLKGRHDFVSATVSCEVKTNGTSTGPLTHRITSLSQLDEPGEGELYLLSLRMVADPLGPYSLDDLIDTVRKAARILGDAAVDDLDDRLGAAGWTPADRGRYDERIRVGTQQLFHVEGDFPRLVAGTFPDGLPDGVDDVTYTLDTNACGPWLVASGPDERGPLAALG